MGLVIRIDRGVEVLAPQKLVAFVFQKEGVPFTGLPFQGLFHFRERGLLPLVLSGGQLRVNFLGELKLHRLLGMPYFRQLLDYNFFFFFSPLNQVILVEDVFLRIIQLLWDRFTLGLRLNLKLLFLFLLDGGFGLFFLLRLDDGGGRLGSLRSA